MTKQTKKELFKERASLQSWYDYYMYVKRDIVRAMVYGEKISKINKKILAMNK